MIDVMLAGGAIAAYLAAAGLTIFWGGIQCQ